MSYPQNHRDEGDGARWNPNPASFQANRHNGAFTSTPIQTPSMTNGLQNYQLVGNQTILNNHLPGPARFQISQQGPKFSDQGGCVPKSMEKPLGHHDAGVGQVSQRLKRMDSTSTQPAILSYHPSAVQTFPQTRGPDSWSEERHQQTGSATSIQQGFTGQPVRQCIARVPCYKSPHDFLASTEIGEQERRTWRIQSPPPSLNKVAPTQTAEQSSDSTNRTGVRDDMVSKLCHEENEIQSGGARATPSQSTESRTKRKRVNTASTNAEEVLDRKRIKVKHRSKNLAGVPIHSSQTDEHEAKSGSGSTESGKAQAFSNKACARQGLTAEEVGPMTFWLRRQMTTWDSQTSEQITAVRWTVPEDQRNESPQLTAAQYAELVEPLTMQEIDEWFTAFANGHVNM